MFCYFILHNHKKWGRLFLNPAVQNPHNPRNRVLLSASEPNLSNFSVLFQMIMGNGEPHACYCSPLWISPSSVVPERQVRLCADKPFTYVSWHQQWTKIRDQTCSLCQDKPSPNGDVVLIPEWCSRTGLVLLALEIQRMLALIENDPVTLSWRERKAEAGNQIGIW